HAAFGRMRLKRWMRAGRSARRAREPNASFANLEFLRIDLRIDLEAIENRFFDRVGSDGAAQAKRKLHAVHVAVVRVVDARLRRRAGWTWRRPTTRLALSTARSGWRSSRRGRRGRGRR